ncbi:MAG: hypothetical protein R2794_12075 [Chitinophagales bacterium]
MKYTAVLLAAGFILCISCNRNTGEKNNTEDMELSSNSLNEDPMNITAEDPFRNQPNALCTIIRKIGPSLYGGKDVQAAEKYCLLDICIDNITNPDLTINLGDASTMVTAYFAVIKIFDSAEEAKQYAADHQIQDVLFTD